MTRRAFNPTAEQRGNVEAMIGYGIPEADICLLIKNPETGKPIDLKTLRGHFAREIATGVTKLKSLAGNRIVAAMLGRDGGCVTDELTQAKLLMLFAETRMAWKETVADEHANEDRRPFIIKVSKTDAKL
jgi:hypothetical protein